MCRFIVLFFKAFYSLEKRSFCFLHSKLYQILRCSCLLSFRRDTVTKSVLAEGHVALSPVQVSDLAFLSDQLASRLLLHDYYHPDG
jgi:hypothetical protein